MRGPWPADDELTNQLVTNAVAGDREAIERLLVQHLPGLHGFARLRMGKSLRAREDSIDLVQSACRQALQALDTFEYRGPATFKDWLYTTVQNKIVDRLRHVRAQRRDLARERAPQATPSRTDEPSCADQLAECYGTLLTPSREAAGKELVGRFEASFEELPEATREVILLSRMVGVPHAEIARRLGKSEGAVRNLLYRGLAKLSHLLDQ